MSQAEEEGKRTTKANSSESNTGTDLISQLPKREEWPEPLLLYKNFWFPRRFLERILFLQRSFKARHDDVILATYPKCGTTWLKALAFTITNRFHYDFSNHPLLSRHPQDLIQTIDIETPLNGDLACIETLPSPRILATHMPFSLLPSSIVSQGCRIIYICRDPKDAFVSWWYFTKAYWEKGDIDDQFNKFCEGISIFGTIWDHCLEYWKESIAKTDRVLFLRYEDMMLEPVHFVKTLALFLGVPFASEEEDAKIPEEITRLCSFETLCGLMAHQKEAPRGNLDVERSTFYRKGKVGDWVNHISEEMGRKLDYIVEEKLNGSGLVF